MRRVIKSKTIPSSLRGLLPPNSPADINTSLYKGEDVKIQLLNDYHSKCVYCECRLNGDYGHIEHFRPKGGYTVPPSNKLITPGYYWLAYDWTNLLLSCSACNSTYKKNHFALVDESKRDIPHKNISKEVALLINPSEEDPSSHIKFHQHILAPKLIGGKESVRGKYTIDLLKLNQRTDLVNYRREIWEKFIRWKKVKILAEELIITNTDVLRGRELLKLADDAILKMKSEESEYSAMFL